MVEVGDRILVESEKVGTLTRSGVVTAVEDRLITVRWDSGSESVFVPSAGSFRVTVHDAVANDEHAVGLHLSEGERAGRRLHSQQTLVFHVRDGMVAETWAHHYDQHATDEFWA